MSRRNRQTSRRPARDAGFTLLEIMIALAILGGSMFLLLDAHYRAMRLHESVLEEIVATDLMMSALGQAELETLAQLKGKEGDLLLTAVQRYSGWDGLRQALVASLPSEMNPQQVINNPQGRIPQNQGDIEGFEVQAFLDVLGNEVVKPMRETENLLGERDYVSRLYTTMSPEEMTVDPTFDFNADMGDVSNVHTAERTVYCSRRVTRANAPWKAVLPDGTVVHGEGNQWPLGPNANDAPPMPATRTIETTGTSGEGEVVEDNTESISQALSKHNSSVPLDPGGCGGCSTNGDSVPVGGLLVLLVSGGSLLWRRRG